MGRIRLPTTERGSDIRIFFAFTWHLAGTHTGCELGTNEVVCLSWGGGGFICRIWDMGHPKQSDVNNQRVALAIEPVCNCLYVPIVSSTQESDDPESNQVAVRNVRS